MPQSTSAAVPPEVQEREKIALAAEGCARYARESVPEGKDCPVSKALASAFTSFAQHVREGAFSR
jgi:hypothetical protein